MDLSEVKLRQSNEIEYIRAAYESSEAWIEGEHNNDDNNDTNEKNDNIVIHRILKLQIPVSDYSEEQQQKQHGKNNDDIIEIDLTVRMPELYPLDENSPLEVLTATLIQIISCGKSRNTTLLRNITTDSLPKLVEACRNTVQEYLEENGPEEMVYLVFNRADDWIREDWPMIVKDSLVSKEAQKKSGYNHQGVGKEATTSSSSLSRKLIYSHHIISKIKRRDLLKLSQEYELGGFMKIGWPGIIIIEGSENNCESFWKEIKRWQWQHIEIRGEETLCGEERKFLNPPLQELDQNQMSYLAQYCQDIGLHDLFKTSMKIYAEDTKNDTADTTNATHDNGIMFSTLVRVDHMNDPKRYEKWLMKTCKANGCIYSIQKYLSGNSTAPATKARGDNKQSLLILVVLMAHDPKAIKQVLTQWRTTTGVDVDSKGHPCKERMMSVLADTIDGQFTPDDIPANNETYKTIEDLKDAIVSFSPSWEQALHSLT